jgi:hypothetical protein
MTTTNDQDGKQAATENLNIRVVELDEPIQRGEQSIGSITIRKPDAGALRGVSLVALGQIDVIALQTVLPRVSTPMLTALEVSRLDAADLMSLGAAIASFLLTKADRAKFLI